MCTPRPRATALSKPSDHDGRSFDAKLDLVRWRLGGGGHLGARGREADAATAAWLECDGDLTRATLAKQRARHAT